MSLSRWLLVSTTLLTISSPALGAGRHHASHRALSASSRVKYPATTSSATTPATRTRASTRRAHVTSVAGGAESMQVVSHRKVSHGATDVVSRKTLDQFVAGTSPLSVLAQTTPGALFSSSDAFGLDTVANTFYLRGFNETQLGATVDGIPMGGQGFHNWNGLGIDQIAIQENIANLTVSQGAGALDTPSAQTLGGAMTFTTSDPEDKAGGRISQLFGSQNGFRTFARVDTGILNTTGTKAYASFARTDQDLWKGYGDQNELQANAKVVQPIGARGKITAVFDYSNFTQYNYLSMTKNMWQVLGRDGIYLKPDYAKSIEYANYTVNGGVPAQYQGRLSNDEIGNFAYDSTQIQRNYFSGLTGDFHLTSNIDSKSIAYAHISNGVYEGSNSSLISPTSQVPMVSEAGHPDVRRLGLVQNFLFHTSTRNEIATGVWYENDRFQYPMMMYADGTTYPHASVSGFTNGTTWWRDAFNTNTFQFHIEDTFHPLRGLTLSAGFRSLIQTTYGGTKADYSDSLSAWGVYYSHPVNGSLTASNAFLPHFSADYHFLDHHEVYVDIAENMRAYDYGAQSASGTAWSHLGTRSNPAQSAFDESKKTLSPERTWNYVVGYRFTSKYVSASTNYYHTQYYNRLIGVSTGPVNNTYNAYLNAGNETVDGVDVLGTIRPLEGLSITNSVSWNHAQYQNTRLPYNGSFVDIKGKQQVFYPKFMYKADVSYDWRGANVAFNANYVGARSITYTNDVKVPAYWSSSLTGGYNFGNVGFAKGLKLTAGVTNLFNQSYIGGVYGAAAVSGDDNAILFAAAPRQYFGTVSAGF